MRVTEERFGTHKYYAAAAKEFNLLSAGARVALSEQKWRSGRKAIQELIA